MILSKRKRHRQKPAPQPSHIIFPLPAVRMLKEALSLFEGSLLRMTKPHPHHPLAKELVEQLKIKLDNMLQMEDWEKETPFDYNEIHILYAAVQMYLIDLTFSRQENLLPVCILLCKQFSQMVGEVK
jgi:hypothetical protein